MVKTPAVVEDIEQFEPEWRKSPPPGKVLKENTGQMLSSSAGAGVFQVEANLAKIPRWQNLGEKKFPHSTKERSTP